MITVTSLPLFITILVQTARDAEIARLQGCRGTRLRGTAVHQCADDQSHLREASRKDVLVYLHRKTMVP